MEFGAVGPAQGPGRSFGAVIVEHVAQYFNTAHCSVLQQNR